MFAGADVQCLSKWCPPRCNDTTRYFIGNAHTDAYFQVKTLQQQDSGCDLDKMFIMGFALK